jgi:hypothetical protein
MPTFADRVCHVVRVTDPYCRILGLIDRMEGTVRNKKTKGFLM